ncbi:bifunctional phosphopantothenoylcysteine decarboxylase/phosphopantothenate--cysteine ligase CoaBC [Teredinibacter haidensis]|uniref:bifunctional phosphopantothenoylcysteine decarboxylase/phosphopantothenate--cysteine ligase CoaBC n=1 Tax=Teredinibacter haidensis TaxID=2731755 RepID=UPI000948BE6A|nr:bifunctional phosphopantothenoylcysteine decarboxylase/phosphopantothenate--cysteine ligase CoaBC [Teredinibacter haidensis]
MSDSAEPINLHSLTNKNILLGITGGIAAYKCAELVRCFKGVGANVRVVMSRAAQEFVTPLTLQALSGNTVHTSTLDADAEAGMGHIELARWADLLLIAPATANVLAKLACGEASDLLTTLSLATHAKTVIAPAMNQTMWLQSATQRNIATLKKMGMIIAGPGVGEQACGDYGPGRMLDIEELAQAAASQFVCGHLAGRRVLITAGPTLEALDPVRYISNRSSGKMGYALADAAVEAGAQVVLVSGPTKLAVPTRVEYRPVESAQEMYEAVIAEVDTADIVIAAAAVADYRPKSVATQKMKKSSADEMVIELVKNPDIVAAVAALPGERFVVGFAAETEQIDEYAMEKLERKGLHAIVANDVSQEDIGFDSDDNTVKVFTSAGMVEHYKKRSKAQLARDLVQWIAQQSYELT